MVWIYLTLAIVAETIGTSALKASDGFTRLARSLVTVAGYALSFWLLALVLKTIPVGIAYAIWSGLGIVLIALIGWLVFGQKLDPPAMIGMGLIVAGIVVMQLSAKV
ncbi:DMT family transporter [Jannaschia ovalis]|uniref:SMR family transporter n=1 Tax=Jannaschia ovalis TaxID=3038773 RepID=A0ABY8LBV9_9RHOB|nr:SMR family transporter [Jannaschia sp. GRR-S6-38]WGH78820.1 SMR family transporter [Jannaschia sp. GRR-S6-38]